MLLPSLDLTEEPAKDVETFGLYHLFIHFQIVLLHDLVLLEKNISLHCA